MQQAERPKVMGTNRPTRTSPAGGAAGAAAAGPDDRRIDTNELQSLADLHASGALNDDEFAAAKAKVLGN